jgi:hypothetical protein
VTLSAIWQQICLTFGQKFFVLCNLARKSQQTQLSGFMDVKLGVQRVDIHRRGRNISGTSLVDGESMCDVFLDELN